MSTETFGASAHSSEPAQKTPAPASMTFSRPSSSPIIPQASMMLAKVSAYAPTTHCRSETLAFRLVCRSPRATLTTVLSRNVRNSSVHSVASASDCPDRGAARPPSRSPETASAWLANRTALFLTGHRPSVTASAAHRWRRAAGVLQLDQRAEAGVAHLPDPVLENGRAGLVGQRGRPAQRDVI